MPSPPRPLPRSRVVQILGLGVSAAALTALVQLSSVWARADVDGAAEAEAEFEIQPDEPGAREAASHGSAAAALPVAATAMPPRVVRRAIEVEAVIAPPQPATVVAVAVAAQPQAGGATEPEPPTRAVMPDLRGKSLRAARRELKAVGLKMSVRDRYNYRVPRDMWGMYKVRSQKVEVGTNVDLGTRVRVKARMRRRFVSGY